MGIMEVVGEVEGEEVLEEEVLEMIVLEWVAAVVIIVMGVKIEGTHIRCHSEDRADGVAHQNLGIHQKNLLDVAAILVAVEVEGTDVEDTGIIQTIRVGLIFKVSKR